MKSFIASLCIMATICAGIITNSVIMERKYGQIEKLLLSLPTQSVSTYELSENYEKHFETLELLNKKWLKIRKYAEISISHDETSPLTDSLASALSYYRTKSFDEYLNHITIAKTALSHIISHEKLTFDKIL